MKLSVSRFFKDDHQEGSKQDVYSCRSHRDVQNVKIGPALVFRIITSAFALIFSNYT